MCVFGLIRLASIVALLSAGSLAFAQDQDSGANDAVSRDVLNELVQKLDSTRFAERQAAVKSLNALPSNALPALTEILAESTGERQRSLQPIVERFRLKVFDGKLNTFLANPSDELAALLPDWSRFSVLAGSGDRAWRVYGEMLTAERRLFAIRMSAPGELSAELEARAVEFSSQCNGRAEEPFPIASCLALMLMASDPDVRLLRATSTHISDALSDPRFEELLTTGAHADLVTAVCSEWMQRPGIAADRPLLFCLHHRLPAGRKIATRIIEARSRRPDMILSLLYLARLDDENDLPLIESLLQTEDVLWPPRGSEVRELLPDREVESTYRVQTRDLALAVALQLRKQDAREFGMHPESSEQGVPVPESVGFNTDSDRQSAFARYHDSFPPAAKNPGQQTQDPR